MGGCVLRVVTRLNRGGPLRQLCALVPALEQIGWTGPVLVGRTEPHEPDGTADLEATGAHVVRITSLTRSLDPAADLRAFRDVLRVVRGFRPDVVHTHMGKAGALGRLAAALAHIPAVHTFHGHHLQAPWPRDRLACLAERLLAPMTDAAVCLTARQRRDLCEVHRAQDASRVQVIGPGIDVEALRRRADVTVAAALRREHAVDDRPLFLWAGRFVPVKDPLNLVRAVALSGRAFRVVMLGEGPMRPEVEREISTQGLQDIVRCVGPIDDPAPWIQACDAVVLSSRSEGAPLLVVEAKVLGRGAIVTTVGGVPDLVRHGIDGWWVPPGSCHDLACALDVFAKDAALRHRLGEAAAEGAAERFSAARLARETAALYVRVRAKSA